MNIRTRFSPSPTGMIHLGNARAALFSALYAKKNNGTFILRIEDTDAERSELRYSEALQDDLKWIGVFWQEGPNVGGKYGPYLQSERQDIYAKYYDILMQQQRIYPCFCSDQELMLARKIQLSRGLPPRYMGTCKKLSGDEIAARIANGKSPAWRFTIPLNTKIEFVDTVKGPQSFNSDDIGDFIVRRADGTAPFLFCNAIDDALMEVSHVLRGEDHIANTPRQLLILQALQLHTPLYGHLSLITGDDGPPLSKRHGSFSIDEMKAHGFLAIALVNYLGRLGHAIDVAELLDFDHFATHFQLEKLSKSPARFDRVQLMYWQKLAVQALTTEQLWEWLGQGVAKLVPTDKKQLFAETIKSNIEFPQDAIIYANMFFIDSFEMNEEALAVIASAENGYFIEALKAIQKNGTDLKSTLDYLKVTLNINGKKLFMPLRVALTGNTHGPELAQIAMILGAEKMQARLRQAESLYAKNI